MICRRHGRSWQLGRDILHQGAKRNLRTGIIIQQVREPDMITVLAPQEPADASGLTEADVRGQVSRLQ
jgi:hypothetical protein